jgi:PPOX class probable F420-dependent enzyme
MTQSIVGLTMTLVIVKLPAMADLKRTFITVNKRALHRGLGDAPRAILDREVVHGDFSPLDAHTHCLLVTYKRDGTAVPAPVWFARDADGRRLYVWTEHEAYKAKRLRRDPRALLAPCTARGVPLGPPIAAVGRVLDDEADRRHAAATIRGAWGPLRRLFERASRPVTPVVYLELTPAPA